MQHLEEHFCRNVKIAADYILIYFPEWFLMKFSSLATLLLILKMHHAAFLADRRQCSFTAQYNHIKSVWVERDYMIRL